jgi:predicted RNA binding protein YcfA (HicA-like mRNA interferase family)
MPNKLRRLSGKDVIKIFNLFGFEISRQRGSHINLVRKLGEHKQILSVPNHKEIDRGTLHEIFKKALRFITENELRQYFYTE